MTQLIQPRTADSHPLAPELRRVIVEAAANAPRSRQHALGASEYGIPCARRLAYKLLDLPTTNSSDGWYPTIGTAVHTWLGVAFDADSAGRWLTDLRVERPVPGTLDLYDTVTRTILDFKLTGAKALSRYRLHGPGEQYRTQVHLYGSGAIELGLPVEQVAIAFLGRCSPLESMHVWAEPYDPAVSRRAVERLSAITELALALDIDTHPERIREIPSQDAYCAYCPWFSRTDPTGCPGHTEESVT